MNKWKNIVSQEVMDSDSAQGLILQGIWATIDITGKVDSVLSVGCGSGTEMAIFQNEGIPKIKGIDLNDTSLKRSRNKGFEVEKMDMHDMEFKNNSFELVFLRDVFEHSWSHIVAIEELQRVSSRYVAIILPSQDWGNSAHHFIIPNLRQMVWLGEKVGLYLRGYREYNRVVGLGTITQSLYVFKKDDSSI